MFLLFRKQAHKKYLALGVIFVFSTYFILKKKRIISLSMEFYLAK